MPQNDENANVGRWAWFENKTRHEVLEFQRMAIEEFNESQSDVMVPKRILNMMNVLRASRNLITVELHRLAKEQAKWMTANRSKYGSDKMALTNWQVSESGGKQEDLKTYLELCKNTLSALTKTFSYLEAEAQNKY